MPVMDMRAKFNLSMVEKTVNTCIIVVEVNLEEETTILGALVDSVQEVFELRARSDRARPEDRHRLYDRVYKRHGEKR